MFRFISKFSRPTQRLNISRFPCKQQGNFKQQDIPLPLASYFHQLSDHKATIQTTKKKKTKYKDKMKTKNIYVKGLKIKNAWYHIGCPEIFLCNWRPNYSKSNQASHKN